VGHPFRIGYVRLQRLGSEGQGSLDRRPREPRVRLEDLVYAFPSTELPVRDLARRWVDYSPS